MEAKITEIEILEEGDGVEAEAEAEEKSALEEEEAEASQESSSNHALIVFDPLRKYLSEVRHFPLLSKDEEFQLAVQYKEEGNQEASHLLVSSHLLLVVKMAMVYRQTYHNVMDLIQEGNIGLLEAIKRFDPYRGLRFSTYAAWWIRAYILKFILDNWKLVRVGTSNARRKLFYNLKKEKQRLEEEGNGYETKLLAKRLNVKENDVIDLDNYLSSDDLSLDAPQDHDSNRTHLERFFTQDSPLDEKLVDQEFETLFWEKIQHFAESLSLRDRYILDQRMIAETPATLQEIGDRYQITREAIRQAEKKLLKRLKAYLRKELPDYINIELRSTD